MVAPATVSSATMHPVDLETACQRATMVEAEPGRPTRGRGLRLRLAGPDAIRSWSGGAVTVAATLDAVTGAPVPGGLNDEAIFGALRAWRCGCHQRCRPDPRQRTCPQCGTPVGDGPGQRDRLGHIDLAAPCVHPWFVRGTPSPLALLLGCSNGQLTTVLAGQVAIVTGVDTTIRRVARAELKGDGASRTDRAVAPLLAGLQPGRVLRPAEYTTLVARWPGLITVGQGAGAIRLILATLDLDAEITRTRAALTSVTATDAATLRRRLALLTGLRASGVRPEWLVLTVLPVLPPALRPTLLRPGGQVVTSDLNLLYARVIRRNERLRRLLARGVPELVIAAEERALQAAVDDLLSGGQGGSRQALGSRRQLAGLGTTLTGKHGRFRRHLLGKRVDYSGRAVIVAGPELRLGQVGLPRQLALELYRPFVVRWLLAHGHASTVRAANHQITRYTPVVWDGLDAALVGRLVLLNRAPTLHRPSLQAFAPVLIDGRAIRLHPLVCAGFNADFDGDGMAVHLPLAAAAQAEARQRLWSVHQLRSPANGEPLVAPSKDIVLGCYYLTTEQPGAPGEGKPFASSDEAILAYELGRVELRARVLVRVPVQADADTPAVERTITTTVGRCLFNTAMPPGLRWRVDVTDSLLSRSQLVSCTSQPEDFLEVAQLAVSSQPCIEQEYQELSATYLDKAALKHVLAVAFDEGGPGLMAEVADVLKDLGFRWATRAGITISAFDVPQAAITDVVADADARTAGADARFQRGLLTPAEHEEAIVGAWQGAMTVVAERVRAALTDENDLAMMARSGARGDLTQLVQLCGLRGLMVGPTGRIIPRPVRSNFRQGLTLAEYWTAAPGARKGRGDTALNTARAGYLTRRLVAATQAVVVTEPDCGTAAGWWLTRGQAGASEFARRVGGRVLAEDVIDRCAGGALPAGTLLTTALATRLAEAGVTAARVRSPLTCAATHGLCRRCYGADPATGELVERGAAVGVVAAQSIGEPGTQLTLRTVHAGGIAHGDDIVAGLPRVEELVEARQPRSAAPLAPCDGTLRLDGPGSSSGSAIITFAGLDGQEHRIALPAGRLLRVADGAVVTAGTLLAAGPLDPRELAATRGLAVAQAYLLAEIQAVYAAQGVTIDDRHVEVVLRQMSRLVRVTAVGDTDLPDGALVERARFAEANDHVLAQGGVPALAAATLVGASEAVLAGDGWLAAAAFGATTRVLTAAALAGRVDRLRGLQEAVLLGRCIPAGTGWPVSPNDDHGRGGTDDRTIADR